MTDEQIRKIAVAIVTKHGSHLASVLRANDNYDGGNLVALCQLAIRQAIDEINAEKKQLTQTD